MGNDATSGKIVYSFATPKGRAANTLFINVIPKYSCPNNCRFCSRADAIKGRPNIYEKKAGANLFLEHAPQIDTVLEAVKKELVLPKYIYFGGTREIVFVGLGEPLLQYRLICDAILGIRHLGYAEKIGLDTNGLVQCMLPKKKSGVFEVGAFRHPANVLKHSGLDEIRISVNATNPGEYDALCRPAYKNAFEKLCDFVLECKRSGMNVVASFVTGFDDGEVKTRPAQDYINFASRAFGIKKKNVLIRQYVPPLYNSNEVK
jgi:TatD family-associated radical SAM protein